MTRDYKIIVTAKHIRDGNPCDSAACPVVLAITEAVGFFVRIAGGKVRPIKQMHGWIALPKEVAEWIRRYDAGDEVGPISFRLKLGSAN